MSTTCGAGWGGGDCCGVGFVGRGMEIGIGIAGTMLAGLAVSWAAVGLMVMGGAAAAAAT